MASCGLDRQIISKPYIETLRESIENSTIRIAIEVDKIEIVRLTTNEEKASFIKFIAEGLYKKAVNNIFNF